MLLVAGRLNNSYLPATGYIHHWSQETSYRGGVVVGDKHIYDDLTMHEEASTTTRA